MKKSTFHVLICEARSIHFVMFACVSKNLTLFQRKSLFKLGGLV
ncbi:hypothetical protein [Candidatus Hamiltonella defensa]|nr:hypothetical protein [Candidatus Hamiltonella defensa]